MPQPDTSNRLYLQYLNGGGEMGKLTRAADWLKTAVGSPQTWPQSLLTTLSILLNSKFPMFLWWGPQLIQFYNDAYRPSFGNSGKHPAALGQPGEQCWPEIWDTIKPLIDQVLEGGESVWSKDQLVPIYRNGRMEDVYWTFSYSKVIDESGLPAGVLVVCTETTEQIESRQTIEKNYRVLADQDMRLRYLVDQAPIGIASLIGRELVIESANDLILKHWGKSKNIIGQSLAQALPELEGQPFLDILDHVYLSGQPYSAVEMQANMEHDRQLMEMYFNFTYQPVKDQEGNTSSILVVAVDVTEQVKARRLIQEEIGKQLRGIEELRASEEHLRLAISAAELGTFDMDLLNGTMDWDPRCRELFGIAHKEKVTYEKDFLQGLHEEDRDRVANIIRDLFIRKISNGDYDVEYRTIGVEDKKLRWVRAKGKVFFNDKDVATRFIGSVLEITDKKLDEQRKNDFIGMVSHELKTPLTSIKGYIQMLALSAKDSDDLFASQAFERVEKQVNRMTNMINGFLNLSRLESGKIQLHMRTFDLDEVINDAISEIKVMSSIDNISFTPCEPIMVLADPEKIGHVITNFLTNALKYSPSNTAIEVDCQIIGNMVQCSVKDHGIGIDTYDLDRIFERYYRVSHAGTERISGFGIGLYLSAEIIERHHGRIWVESEKGKGSTFYFTLPST